MKRGNKQLLVVGDRVLVKPEKTEAMTKVGLFLPPGVLEKEEVRGGHIVAVGPGQPLPPQPSLNEISPEALASVREVEKRARKLTLMELTERTCKWPIGDPSSTEFSFCGRRASEGVYCQEHARVAYQPQMKRGGKEELARSLRRYI